MFKTHCTKDVDKSESVQMVPLPGMGWCDMDGRGKPVWMTTPEAAKACLELLKSCCKQDVPADVNIENFFSLARGYASVQENAAT